MSLGCYANSYLNGVSIGYNAGNNCNLLGTNTGCTFIGSYSNMAASNTSITNSTAIGIGSLISNSNTIQLGRDLLDTTNCYALTTTNLTSTNITNTNLSATNITTSNLISNGTITYNYATLPLLSSFKVNGFSSSVSNLRSITAYDTVYQCSTLTLPCGVYYINYTYSINYSGSTVNYFLNYRLGSTALLIDTQNNKSYCSSSTSNVYNCSNSFRFTSTNGSILLS